MPVMDNLPTKESNMNENDKIVNFRLNALEANHLELRNDLKEVKNLCIKMDKKLSTVPESGFNCDIHNLRMGDLSKRVDRVENTTETITKKIVTWTSAIAVIIFLLSQIAIPYILGSFKIHLIDNNSVPTISNTNNVAIKNSK